jgi:hypothetical protein
MKRLAVLLACLWLGSAGVAWAAGRRVVVLIDTSGSMVGTDPQRYTVQLAQIVADLLDDSDQLTIVRLGGFALFCGAGPSPDVALRLDPANRSGFKSELDRMISYSGDNSFAIPIRTAVQALSLDSSKKRMLLMIADSGGLAPCEGPLTAELVKLHDSGAVVAAVNIGSTTGAFEHNPAFDLTTPAQNPRELVEAVAQVYQRFLGERKVQTGTVQGGGLEVEMDSYVREAFLVVSADGPIGRLEPGSGNPPAASLDPDYRGGGQTVGLDGQTRGYRIVRFERPGPGRWRFRLSGQGAGAAWVLIQQDTLGVRLISPGKVAEGAPTLLQVEMYDTETGQPVRGSSTVPGAAVSLQIDGQEVTLRDDGSDGDQKPGDGIFSTTHTFQGTGKRDVGIRLRTRTIDRTKQGEVEVVEAGWRVVPPPAQRAELGTPVPLRVDLEPLGAPAAPRVPPERIEVRRGGSVEAELRSGPAAGAGPLRYEGTWNPASLGTQSLELVPVGGSMAAPATMQVEVLGKLDLGKPVPIRFGALRGESEGSSALDLSQAVVKGGFDLEVTSAFESSGAQLEMETAAGWVPLGAKPVSIRLEDDGARLWPLRLRVGSCPAACAPSEPHRVVVTGLGADGQPQRLEVPLTAEVIPDPWLQCWWPVLALVAGTGFLGFVVYGYWSPSRFAPRVGVMISQEEDVNEGAFYLIRDQRGSGSGFYRDAMIYVGDYRLTNKPRGVLARLRAHRNQVRIRPMSTLWRQNVEGEWEQLGPDEAPVRSGVIYRNDSGTLFFELRNR